MKFETKFNLDDYAWIIIYRWEDDKKIAEIRQALITGVSCYQARRKKTTEINYYTDLGNGAIKEVDLYATREEAIQNISLAILV